MNTIITLPEYKFLSKHKIKVKIRRSVCWDVPVSKRKYPYRKAIDTLMQTRDSSDVYTKTMIKDILVRAHGKLAQASLRAFYNTKLLRDQSKGLRTDEIPNIYLASMDEVYKAEDVNGTDHGFDLASGIEYVESPMWNLLHYGHSTANQRIDMCDLLNRFKDEVVLINIDSVVTKSKLPEIEGFTEKGEGQTIILGPGNYQIGDKIMHSGFKEQDLFKLLRFHKDDEEITMQPSESKEDVEAKLMDLEKKETSANLEVSDLKGRYEAWLDAAPQTARDLLTRSFDKDPFTNIKEFDDINRFEFSKYINRSEDLEKSMIFESIEDIFDDLFLSLIHI